MRAGMTALQMNRRIVIIGFMGCGKSAVAKELACQLACESVDLDLFIIEREGGRTPAEIISSDGETAFREIESLALRDALLNRNAQVIALGGGAWTIPANRTLVALHDCRTVWLDAPFDLCWRRIQESADSVRPLAPDLETAKRRYQSRAAVYALADQRLAVDESTDAKTIAAQILRQS